MAKQPNANKDSGNIVQRNEKGQLLPGVILNPVGKPVGTIDFKTKWFRFIDKVAAQNNITSDEVDEQLLAVGFKQAKEANYSFWKDIQDRVHGTALQKSENTNLNINSSPAEMGKFKKLREEYENKLLDEIGK